MTEISTYKPPANDQGIITSNNPHVRALADAFEIAFTANGKSRELVEARIPRKLTIRHTDGKVYNARELILSEGIVSTPLIQTQYLNTVLEGARLVQCARQALRTETAATGNTMRMPFSSTRTGRAPEVPEGSPYPISNGTYEYRDFTYKKYGERAPITKEMVSDGLYNTMALEVGFLGEHCENSLNYEAIGVILQNSGKEHDTAGTNQGIKALAMAKLLLKGKASDGTGGFAADTAIVTSEFDTNLNKEFMLTNYHGGQTVVNGGTPPAVNLRYFETNSAVNSTSYTWGYSTDGDIGALVLNQMAAGAYVLRWDTQIEDLVDPIRDLQSAKASIRFGVNYGIANAACRIKY